MKVSVEELSATRRKVAVELMPDDVEKEIERSYRELSRSIQLKGFRPGRAPRAILKQLYGKDLEEELAGKLIEDSIPKVLEEHKLEPVATPVIEDKELAEDHSFRYTALVEVEPSLEVKDYKGVEVKGEKPSASDEDVERSLEQLRLSRSKLIEREGTGVSARRGDFVVADWDMEIEGKDGPPSSRQDGTLELAPGGAMLPELVDGLEGIHAGETRTIEATLGEAVRDAELAGKKATFKITAKKVQERVLPELTDELAKEVSGLESVDALRADLREKIQARLERDARGRQQDQIVEKLLEAHEFEPPESLVEQTVQTLTRLSGGEGPESEAEERKAAIEAAAKRRVRADLILKRVADQEGITASEEDVDQALADRAHAIGQDVQVLRAAYQRKGLLDELRGDVKRQRALDFLLENAKILDT